MTLRPAPDVSEADWLHDAHPALGPDGFAARGRVLHPFAGEDRVEGHLDDDTLAALCRVLARHTGTPDDCLFALWDGYGEIHGGEAVGFLTTFTGSPRWPGRMFRPDPGPKPPPPAFPAAVMDGPRATIAGLEHLLFTGALREAGSWGALPYGAGLPRAINSPNLMWPRDRAWCTTTHLDSPWTSVVGSLALVDDLLAGPGLEVVRATA